MSYRKFRGSNTESNTRRLFNERGKYNNEGIPESIRQQYPGLFRNFWFIENMYYGKIDRFHRFMMLREEKLRQVNSVEGGTLFLVDFAAHALDDLIKEHKRAFTASKIQKNDEFLSEINPLNGHKQLLTEYDLHMTRIRDQVHAKAIRKNEEIQDFDDFIAFFIEDVKNTDQIVPLTLTGFIASRLSSQRSTGLFVDLVNIDSGDDAFKVSSIIDRPNYKFIINNCIKHGFMLDYNIPTRLCANLGSGEMEKYMNIYGTNSQNVFVDYYEPVYRRDHVYLMEYLRKFYNRFVRLRPNIRKEQTIDKKTNKIFRYVQKRKIITDYELNNNYNIQYRIDLYADIRNYESNNRYSPSVLEELKKNAISYLNTESVERALEYVDYQFIGFLNDLGAYNGLILKQDIRSTGEKSSGQELQELLDRSVVESRKTLY